MFNRYLTACSPPHRCSTTRRKAYKECIVYQIQRNKGRYHLTGKVTEFKKRYSEITSRLELLELEEEIKEFMTSEAIKILPDEEKDTLDDILIKVINIGLTRLKPYFQYR